MFDEVENKSGIVLKGRRFDLLYFTDPGTF